MARRTTALLAAGLLVLAAACGDSEDDDEGSSNPTGEGADPSAESTTDCSPDALELVNDDVLTVGTDSPAFPPWFQDDDPTNGEGFESAVAYAVAEELGFPREEVTWATVPFNNVIAPGDKPFDFAINQVSITEEREDAVDFSDPYYETNQALVGYEDSPAASATSLEDLRSLRLGAQVGTTSLDFITEVIQPESEPRVYNDNSSAKAALDAQQVDAVVFDLPTAFYVSAVEMEGTKVIGQFPADAGGESDAFGLVFAEGNPLRDCANEALATLRDSGRLAEIEQEWLSDVVDAPVIPVD
ncbi:MAG TPA: ABC transporter substrate-binding protein [Acidimicrobiales bacterium]